MGAFRLVASFNIFLAVLYALSALWVTVNPASGCTVDGQPCASFGLGSLILYIGAPPLILLLVVLVGARIRQHRPRAALAMVAFPLLLSGGLITLNLLGLGG